MTLRSIPQTQYEMVDHPLTEEEELYKENILDHYQHPHNKGVIAHPTISHTEFNHLCGDKITIYIQINPKSTTLSEVSFEGSGCAISQAAASMLTDAIKSKTVAQLKQLGPWDVFNLLGIRISHTRSKCALLCLKAVQKGIAEPK